MSVAQRARLADAGNHFAHLVGRGREAIGENNRHQHSDGYCASEIADKDEAPVLQHAANRDAGPFVNQREWRQDKHTGEQIEAKQLQNLENILGSAQHLLLLINAALDLAKIEAGRTEVHASEIALAPLLDDCVRSVEPLLGEEVRLGLQAGSELPPMQVDDEKLRQIVINLLSNAVKFTARGRIDVAARCLDGRVEVSVAGTGIGIPADRLEAVFEEFEQVDASSTRAHGGSGLGLAIARRLARLMGGELRAQTALGVGSTFTLCLPLHYRPPAP